MTTDPQTTPRYLGDGVYASFDGYQIWLHVGSHDARPVVALEPKVIDALNQFAGDIWKASVTD
jgi:hypothetical protein